MIFLRRQERTRLLLQFDLSLLEKEAAHICHAHHCQTLKAPAPGLVMVTIQESVEGDYFYAGEVLVTECKVTVDGIIGLGLVKGYDTRRAKALAIIDAAFRADFPEVKSIEGKLEAFKIDLEQSLNKEANSLAKTRVQFETIL
ncbi:MAG: hypothetical protein BSOLF_2617 [Candidatus Carbobacillus altaicus]|uniref:PhnG protein n=1 Tax=Candidatus Carbonibacillus altaicus TaxID=2163959 RepID=A0A2R6Y2E6_9BACL|nr:MAG: hypothetical protein BSOLF_2617 [Candidatus Carbobacillus altaicus]